MLFKRPLLEKIRAGTKTQTRRLIKRKKGCQIYQVGQRVGVKCQYVKATDFILITKKFRQRLGDISEVDARKEGFGSVEEFKQTWISLYGKWQPNLVVWVYEFKLAEPEVAGSASISKLVQ